MKRLLSSLALLCSTVLLFNSCGATKPAADQRPSAAVTAAPAVAPVPAIPPMPEAEREFRAAWVATVANIDWPSKPGLPTDRQQAEALAILDSAAHLHLNAIILQVRPQCDAMYPSKLEPWSYFLTGTQGKAPEPFYDPLAFWVEQAHNRGLELHVWFNPYRAHTPSGGPITETSVVRTHPGLAQKIPDGTYWLDPGMKETQDHSYAVVMDVVKRYDVDGVHFDDYFYPYPSGDGSFPDDASWKLYTQSGGTLSREDWRRQNVNTFIERIYRGIKAEKPHVKFGISPFGIWRPSYPASIGGFDQYDKLYADARLWLNKGWVDYWTPQLYWPINRIAQSFPVLLGWWSRENTQHRNLWPGMIITSAPSERGTDEIINEIMIERGMVPDAPGHVHFSMKVLMKDSSTFNASLLSGPYHNQALVPPSPWLGDKAPAVPVPSARLEHDTIRVDWTHPDASGVFHWVVYYQYEKQWQYAILNRNDHALALPASRPAPGPARTRRNQQQQTDAAKDSLEHLTRIAVSAVDRLGNESERVELPLTPVK